MSTTGRPRVRYTRLSKGRASIRRQKTITDTYLAKLGDGGAIVEDFSDSDTTAYAKPGEDQPERPDFNRLIAYLSVRTGLAILVWHIDRLIRDARDAATLARVCTANGHIIETSSGDIYDLGTAGGRKRLRDDASDAEHEVDHLRERVLAAKEEARAAGLWLGRSRPFGWNRVRAEDGEGYETGLLELNPVEAQAVADADARILGGGSESGIARDWNEAGLTTVAGKAWSARGVRTVLTRESNWAPPPALWPALVDETTHRAVVAILSAPERKTTTGPEPKHLMSTIMRCGATLDDGTECGAAIIVQPQVRAVSGAVYRCSTFQKPGTKTGPHVSRDKARVDEFVSEVVIARFEEEDAAGMLHRPGLSELPALDTQRAELLAAMDASNELRRDGLLTLAEFAAERRQHKAELADLDQRIARARAADVLAPMLRNPRETWPTMPLDQQRAIIRTLATWTMLPTRRGRPRGWTPGEPYFDTSSIRIEWHGTEVPSLNGELKPTF